MNVLIITEHFPPSIQVSAYRIESWYRYFPEKEIRPIVLTMTTAANGKDIYSIRRSKENKLTSRLGLIVDSIYDFVAFEKSAYKPVLRKAIDICSNHTIDYIIASGAPFQLFKVAQLLSSKTGIPWIADYRDGWSTNVTYKNNKFSKRILSSIYTFFEQRIVKTCDFIITASPSYKEPLTQLFPWKSIHVIYNGFIEEDFLSLKSHPSREKLVITYLGTLYSYQKLEVFLNGMNTYLANHTDKKVEINFFGLNKSEYYRLDDFKKSFPGVVNIYPKTDRREALKAASNSNVLLLLLSKDTIAIPAKVFDYIALKLPILVVENDEDVVYDILQSNPYAYFANNSGEVVDIISNIQTRSNSIEEVSIKKWSRREQAYNLTDLMQRNSNQVVANK